MSATKIKKSRDNVIFDIFVYAVLILALIVVLYPLYFVLIASISDPYMVLRGDVTWLPKGITFDSYKKIFTNADIWRGYANSIKYTVLGTILSVTLTVCLAYPLSRKYFCLRKPISLIVLITMYFSGGMVPTYILVSKLGLRNTIWSIILVGAVSAYNVIIARTFFESNIPSELEEAAEIDGCTKGKFFFYFVPQLSKAIIAVLTLYYAVAYWNDYMKGLLYIDKSSLYPLQIVLRGILIETQALANDFADVNQIEAKMKLAESMKYGTIIVAIVPPLLIYPVVQKYFVKGVMIGSIKG